MHEQELGTKILQAALALHDKVASTFRKTAVNFHYEFTVRHLANVFQGLLMSTPEQFNNPNKLSRLWLHESERVYADRLVSQGVSSLFGIDVDALRKILTATCFYVAVMSCSNQSSWLLQKCLGRDTGTACLSGNGLWCYCTRICLMHLSGGWTGV